MDGFSGAKIAAKVTTNAAGSLITPQMSEWASKQYASYLESSDHGATLPMISPSGQAEQASSRMTMIGPIMAGIFTPANHGPYNNHP